MFKKILLQALALVLFAIFAVASSETTYTNSSSSDSSSNSSQGSFLSPASFPTTSSDYSFGEKVDNATNGYR